MSAVPEILVCISVLIHGLKALAPIESLLDEDIPIVRFAKIQLALMLLFPVIK